MGQQNMRLSLDEMIVFAKQLELDKWTPVKSSWTGDTVGYTANSDDIDVRIKIGSIFYYLIFSHNGSNIGYRDTLKLNRDIRSLVRELNDHQDQIYAQNRQEGLLGVRAALK